MVRNHETLQVALLVVKVQAKFIISYHFIAFISKPPANLTQFQFGKA